MKQENETLLIVKDLSKRANISPSTLYSILHYDRLPFETIGDRIVVKESVYNEWAKTNIKESNKKTKRKDK